MAIRSSRRGALFAGLLLWPLVLLATMTTPGASEIELRRVLGFAVLSWPGLALLGAALAPAALGSRVDAVAAGLALAVGAPLAAVASALIGVFIIAAVTSLGAGVGEALGTTIRLGVLGAVRVSPLVALAVTLWVISIRRLEARAAT